MTSVLIVEDERSLREGLASAVSAAGHRVFTADGVDDARKILEREAIGCMLLDLRLRDGDGITLLRTMRRGDLRDVPVVIATAYGDSERTIEAMRDGAFDYVTKPFDLDQLLAIIERALTQHALTKAIPARLVATPSRGGLVGTSEAMLGVWKVIGRAASSTAPVLIMGETGTGKELVARAIHQFSSRALQPFVAVNLSSLSPSLIESELMGHERGAFTGATSTRQGRIELASNGTLLLDEIGDLDSNLQTKLLRVLQDGGFERVGGEHTLQATARIIAATNKPVRPRESAATLREDLYYRLAVIEIVIPPLRSRRIDIPLLAAHALETTNARALTDEAMACLITYDWPGNVRELIHVIDQASVMCGSDVIDLEALPSNVRQTASAPVVDEASESLTLRAAMAAFERRVIVSALEHAGGNRSEAARRLGIARTHLYTKMEEHGIGVPERPPLK